MCFPPVSAGVLKLLSHHHVSWQYPFAMISRSTLLVLLPLVFASPLERRNTTCCGQFDTVTSDPYSLLANQWGKSDAESGWQCSTLTSVLGDTAAWSTQWDWVGGNTIKSFSNIQLNKGINQQLSAITSISVRFFYQSPFSSFH